ncbi:hypothetical protein [Actinomadura kijaniata]|uniref:hypothetical protein n=1 Tax=Actinomadura kijaniata TaxID=46161 RepID=UPI00082F9F41|nr:hypothetical protein [Actinomadura kijaniata]
MRSPKSARATFTALAAGAAAVAAVGLAGPAQATATTSGATDVSARAATPWKTWTLQPGAAGVATHGKSRTNNGRAEVHVTARDTAADQKGAYVWVIRYFTTPGHNKVKIDVPSDGRERTWDNMGGPGYSKITVQECVDNTWTSEVCSPVKTVWTR